MSRTDLNNWNQKSRSDSKRGIRRSHVVSLGLLSRVSGAQQAVENEAEENPRITAIEAPETSNLARIFYRFTFNNYRKIKRRFYRLFVKNAN
jgi:hypothetical protein